MLRSSLVACIATFAAVLTQGASDARACGGCFVPRAPPPWSPVTGWRSRSLRSRRSSGIRSVQRRSGGVCLGAPVARGATIETGAAAWFEVLEATTRRTIVGPTLQCPLRNSSVAPALRPRKTARAAAEGSRNRPSRCSTLERWDLTRPSPSPPTYPARSTSGSSTTTSTSTRRRNRSSTTTCRRLRLHRAPPPAGQGRPADDARCGS